MRHIILLLFIGSYNLIVAQTDSLNRPYGIKSGRLTFQFFEGPQKGTKILTFNNWGEYEKMEIFSEADTALIIKMKIPAEQLMPKQSQLMLNTPEGCYGINMDTKFGFQRACPDKAMTDLLFQDDKKFVGYDTVLDRKCEVFVIEKFIKLWFWNKLCIKKELLNTDGFWSGEYVIQIDENYKPTEYEFEIPPGTKIN